MKFDSEVVRFHLNCPHESRNQADCNTMLLAEVVATLKDVDGECYHSSDFITEKDEVCWEANHSVFETLIEESGYFNSLEKSILFRFGVESEEHSKTLYLAAFRVAMYTHDLEHFFKGIGTIADILLGIETVDNPHSPLAADQSMVTIAGLKNLILSAEELLKSNVITKGQYVTLLGATFSRNPSMELVFALFRSPMYHKLVAENSDTARIGNSIIFHCIDDLTDKDYRLTSCVSDGRKKILVTESGLPMKYYATPSFGLAGGCKEKLESFSWVLKVPVLSARHPGVINVMTNPGSAYGENAGSLTGDSESRELKMMPRIIDCVCCMLRVMFKADAGAHCSWAPKKIRSNTKCSKVQTQNKDKDASQWLLILDSLVKDLHLRSEIIVKALRGTTSTTKIKCSIMGLRFVFFLVLCCSFCPAFVDAKKDSDDIDSSADSFLRSYRLQGSKLNQNGTGVLSSLSPSNASLIPSQIDAAHAKVDSAYEDAHMLSGQNLRTYDYDLLADDHVAISTSSTAILSQVSEVGSDPGRQTSPARSGVSTANGTVSTNEEVGSFAGQNEHVVVLKAVEIEEVHNMPAAEDMLADVPVTMLVPASSADITPQVSENGAGAPSTTASAIVRHLGNQGPIAVADQNMPGTGGSLEQLSAATAGSNNLQERKLKRVPLQPGWFQDPLWIKVGSPYFDGTAYQDNCLLLDYNKAWAISKCTLGDKRKQFTFDPTTSQLMAHDGTCLTPSNVSPYSVTVAPCEAHPSSTRQKVHFNLFSGQLSFPYYHGNVTQANMYATPKLCLEFITNGGLRTLPCNTAIDKQKFSAMILARNIYSMSHPGKCISVVLPSKTLRLAKCSMKDLNQLFYYDPLNFMFVSTHGRLEAANSTAPLLMGQKPGQLFDPKSMWTFVDGVAKYSMAKTHCIQVETSTLDVKLAPCQQLGTQIFTYKLQNPSTCDDGNKCTREGIFEGQCVYLDAFGFPDSCSGEDQCVPGLINCDDADTSTIDFCTPDIGCQYIRISDLTGDAAFTAFESIIDRMEAVPAIIPKGDVSAYGMAVNPVALGTSSILYTSMPSIAFDEYNLMKIIKWIRSKADMANSKMCWKRSYGRGVGHGIDTCPGDKEKIGLLCYDRCPAGFTRLFGGDCYQNCKQGWSDHGFLCRLSEYGRGWGYPWMFGDGFNLDGAYTRCNRENPRGCEQNGALVYPKCAPGYYPFGCCICRPNPFNCQSEGYSANQVDLSCGKQRRPGNPTPLICPSNMQQDGLLCYPFCESGYRGIGPVCWQDCDVGLVDCAGGCAIDTNTCAMESVEMVRATATMGANLVMRGATKVPQKTDTTIEIGGKHYEGGTALGKTFLKAVKKLQTIVPKGSTDSWSYGARVIQKRAGTQKNLVKTARKLDGRCNSLLAVSSRALSGDFERITSPEIHTELRKRLNAQNLQHVKDLYSKIHLGALSNSDAWNLANTVVEFVGLIDLTGVSNVVAAYAKPVCSFVPELTYKDPSEDWTPCTKSSDCESSCCSGAYSSGALKCTPSLIGFNPDICIGSNPQKRLQPGAECITSEECESSNPLLGVGCCSNNNDGQPHQCRNDVMLFDSNLCLGSPAKFTLGALESCQSSLECQYGCCTGKYSNGIPVCTELRIGFDPVFNQCLGSLYPDWSPCQYSHMCQSGCCTSKYSTDSKLRCAALSPGFNPSSNACVARAGFEWL